MAKITGNEPVNPVNGANGVLFTKGHDDTPFIEGGIGYAGLTIRQKFAETAMLVVAPPIEFVGPDETEENYRNWAKTCCKLADALIAELNKNA